MRKLFTYGLALFTCFRAGGQNLVPNASFEQFSACPITFGELDKAVSWSKPSAGSTDYFHTCSGPGSVVGVPAHYSNGYQYPRQGDGYVGITTYKSTYPDYREYIQAPLSTPLKASACYYAEFFVNKKNTAHFSSDNLNIHFHKGPKTSLNSTYLDLPVHISSPLGQVIEDTFGWVPVGGYYVAQGGEDHILIGNFRSDGQTSYSVHMPSSNELYAYYYIDDVNLTPVDDSIDLGPDTVLCPGEELVVDIRLPEATYLWADGLTEGYRVISSPGVYSVKVNIGLCAPLEDSLRVSYVNPPSINLGGDTSICFGQLLSLSASTAFGNYLWQDQSTQPVFEVSEAGIYFVDVINPCGRDQDTISVEFIDCQGLLFAPNAFTPNADGINDQFRLVGSGIVKMDFRVYDRWGREVFRGSDPGAAWDGRSGGKAMPQGVYQWVATYTGGGATQLEREGRMSGMVILLR